MIQFRATETSFGRAVRLDISLGICVLLLRFVSTEVYLTMQNLDDMNRS